MSYEPDVLQGPYVTVGGPFGGEPAPAKPTSGWGPLVAVIGLGVFLLLGYVGYRVVTHFWLQPSPYSVRHAATANDTTIVFPHRLAGMTRLDNGIGAEFAKVDKDVPSGVEVRSAAYGVGDVPAAFVYAGAMPVSKADRAEITRWLGTQRDLEGLKLKVVDPGPMGGQMSCGLYQIESLRYTMCVYVDAGAFGIVAVDVTGPAARSRVLAIRAGVEHRLS